MLQFEDTISLSVIIFSLRISSEQTDRQPDRVSAEPDGTRNANFGAETREQNILPLI